MLIVSYICCSAQSASCYAFGIRKIGHDGDHDVTHQKCHLLADKDANLVADENYDFYRPILSTVSVTNTRSSFHGIFIFYDIEI